MKKDMKSHSCWILPCKSTNKASSWDVHETVLSLRQHNLYKLAIWACSTPIAMMQVVIIRKINIAIRKRMRLPLDDYSDA